MKQFLITPARSLANFFSLLLISFSLNTMAQTGLWSNPATWGGSLPAAGSTVNIAPGQTVILDVNPPSLKGIQVRGTLIFADQNINLSTGYILVTGGELRIGTEAAPFNHKATITFTGDIHDVTGMGLGNKFLMVMGGGRLELHGARAHVQSWTQLRKNASVGNVIIETVDAVNWRVGDKIVIAPSGTKAEQAEVRTIVNITGHQIRLNSPLNHQHFGRIDSIDGYVVDMRAEVGLLTRDIVLQGDAASESSKNGGHVMIMNGSQARVEGVEFYRMGWYGEGARYPLHWHFSGNSYSEYARNNSIHRSFHRGIVTHGSNGIKVISNVAYDVVSHCYVIAEDGDEVDNQYIGNLGVYITRLPSSEYYAFPGGQFGSLQSERHPGVFWTTSPNHIVRDNHAAGSVDGMGFFYDGNGTATSMPNNAFTGNVAHSNSSSEGSYDRAHYRTTGWGLFVGAGLDSGEPMVFSDFTGYKNTLGGAWLEGENVVLRKSVLASNGSGVNIQRSSLHLVGLIKNTSNQIANTTKDIGAINIFTSFTDGNKEPKILDVDVIGFDKRIVIEEDAVDVYSYVRNINFIGGSGPRVKIDRTGFKGALVDLRGTVSTSGQPTIYLGRNYNYTTSSCVLDGPANANRCSARDYANLTIHSDPYTSGRVGNIRLTRSAGGSNLDMYESAEIKHWWPEYRHRQIQWIPVDEVFTASFTSDPMPSEFFLNLHGFKESGSRIIMTVPSGKVPRLYREDGSLITASPSIAALNYSNDGWFYNESDRKLYVSISLKAENSFQKNLKVRLFSAREGVADLGASNVLASPNPFREQLNIQFDVLNNDSETSIRMFDAQGRVAYEENGMNLGSGINVISIDGSNFSPGTYIYEIRSGDQIHQGSVIRVQN